MKAGTRLKSAVCATEVMVIKAGRPALIACGGAPMVEERGESGTVDPGFAAGTKIGKRYQDAEGAIELLCVKAGEGSLSADGVALTPKEAKPLPSSD